MMFPLSAALRMVSSNGPSSESRARPEITGIAATKGKGEFAQTGEPGMRKRHARLHVGAQEKLAIERLVIERQPVGDTTLPLQSEAELVNRAGRVAADQPGNDQARSGEIRQGHS